MDRNGTSAASNIEAANAIASAAASGVMPYGVTSMALAIERMQQTAASTLEALELMAYSLDELVSFW